MIIYNFCPIIYRCKFVIRCYFILEKGDAFHFRKKTRCICIKFCCFYHIENLKLNRDPLLLYFANNNIISHDNC